MIFLEKFDGNYCIRPDKIIPGSNTRKLTDTEIAKILTLIIKERYCLNNLYTVKNICYQFKLCICKNKSQYCPEYRLF